MTALPFIVFDVNETLLDLDALEPTFERIFRDKSGMRLWFANLIVYSQALTLADSYAPFTEIGSAVLKMMADAAGVTIDDRDRSELKEKLSTMPPFPDVAPGLEKLRSAGFRLFTLTNNPIETQRRQLQHGGVYHMFEKCLSVDAVRAFKPARQVYAHVETELMARPSQLCLVACHTWDTLGAVAAGWEAALVKRPGNDLLAVGPQPQIVGNDLHEVADRLIARYEGRRQARPA